MHDENQQKSDAHPETPRLQCPRCGYDGLGMAFHGGTFELLEDQTYRQSVVRVGGGKKLIVTEEKKPDWLTRNQRLECRNCLEAFELPEDWEVEASAPMPSMNLTLEYVP